MKKIDEKIIRFVKENDLLQQGEKILLALSGGADSVFLLHFLLKYKRKYKVEIGAMHVNHMIRGKEADSDEKFCGNLCSKLGIEYFSVKRDVPAFAKRNKISIEEAAREIRYKELSKIQEKFKYDKIATAHTCSDNAETVLLNLIKGTGIKGLSGIPIIRGSVIRPILNVTKDEILEYLKKNNVHFRFDKTNLSNAHERNFIRNELFPLIKKRLNPKIEQTLFKSSAIFKKQTGITNTVIKIIKEHTTVKKKDQLEILIDELAKFDEDIWSDIVKVSLDGNFQIQTSFNDCSKVISLFNKQVGKTVDISNQLTAIREKNKIIVFFLKEQKKSEPVEIMVGGKGELKNKQIKINCVDKNFVAYSNDKNIEYIDANRVTDKFSLRFWKNGDRFQPFGLKGSKNISDFLNDQKIPAIEKRQQLVLVNKNKIVWVVGYRIDDQVKITDKTKKVLQLCLS